MRKRSIYTIPAAATLIIALGLTTGALLPEPGVGAPTPSAEQLATTGHRECEVERNRICDNMPEAMERSAWKAWDASGARRLKVDPARPFKVVLIGYSTVDPHAQGEPELDIYDLALEESGIWYVFRAEYTDVPVTDLTTDLTSI